MRHLGYLDNKTFLISSLVLFLSFGNAFSQKLTVEKVPRTLDFGEFWTSNGGNIIIDEYGNLPTIDTDIIHINRQPSGPVTFNIKSTPGKNIYFNETITNTTDCILTVKFDKVSGVVNPYNSSTWFPIQMGGTLSVPPNPSPGNKNILIEVKFSLVNE